MSKQRKFCYSYVNVNIHISSMIVLELSTMYPGSRKSWEKKAMPYALSNKLSKAKLANLKIYIFAFCVCVCNSRGF